MVKEIEEMNKAVKCLAIVVPEPVYETFSAVWNTLRDSLLTPSADVQERAKELELFKRLWYNRNPVHENNADSGEDMFWGTAELVAREYAQHLAGASSVSGMQWVKASERLPENKKVNGGILACNGFYFCKCEDDCVDVCQFKPEWGEFRHITIRCECQEYKEEKADVIYWLDESGASSLQAENERLREVLEKIKGIAGSRKVAVAGQAQSALYDIKLKCEQALTKQ